MKSKPIIEISTSQAAQLRTCEQAAVYGTVQNLTRRTLPVPMTRGSWLHLLLAAHYLDREVRPGERGWKAAWRYLEGKYVDEVPEDQRTELPGEVGRLMQAYLYHWRTIAAATGAEEFTTVAVEPPLVAEYESRHAIFRVKATIDLIGRDRDGNHFIMEHKSGKEFPYNAKLLASEPQMTAQMAAARAAGYPVTYGVYNYIRTEPPTVPKVVDVNSKKGPRLSRSEISTDYRTYLRAIKENDLNPDDYADELAELRDPERSKFFRRVLVAPRHERVAAIQARDLMRSGARLDWLRRHPDHAIREGLSYGQGVCGRCMFQDLCYAEMEDVNAPLIRERDYTQRVDDRKWLFEETAP